MIIEKEYLATQTFLYIVILFVLTGCDNRKNSIDHLPIARNHDLQTFKVPETRPEKPVFQNFVKGLDIIPLETNDQSLIGEVYKLIIKNKKIYIQDRDARQILIFDNDGKFLSKLSKVGNGPDEYTELTDFHVDDSGNIYVLGMDILIYDSNLDFSKRIKYRFETGYHINPTQFAPMQDGVFCFFSGASLSIKRKDDGQFAIYLFDSKDNSYSHGIFPLVRKEYGGQRFYEVDDLLEYSVRPLVGIDSIYRVKQNGFYPSFFIDFGSRKLPEPFPEDFGVEFSAKLWDTFENTDYVVFIDRVIETNTQLYFFHRSGNKGFHTFCSKNSGKVTTWDCENTMEFFPYFIKGAYGNKLVGEIDAIKIINSREMDLSNSFDYLPDIKDKIERLNSVKETDNPVLMVLDLL